MGVAFGGAAEGDYDYPWVHGLPDWQLAAPEHRGVAADLPARDEMVGVPLESRGDLSGAATGEDRWPLLQPLLTVDLVASPASATAGCLIASDSSRAAVAWAASSGPALASRVRTAAGAFAQSR